MKELENFKCPFCNFLLFHCLLNKISVFSCENEDCKYWNITRFQIEINNSSNYYDRVFLVFKINNKWYQFFKSFKFNEDSKIYISQIIKDKRQIDLFEIEENLPININTIFDLAKAFIERFLKIETFI